MTVEKELKASGEW